MLANTAIFSAENEMSKEVDFDHIIDEFPSVEARKLKLQ